MWRRFSDCQNIRYADLQNIFRGASVVRGSPPEVETPRLVELLRANPECRDMPLTEEPYKTAIETAGFLDGFPRHPKMHPCGVAFSRRPMHTLTPTFIANKGYVRTHFDINSVEAVGLVTMDILAQGGLAVISIHWELFSKLCARFCASYRCLMEHL
jgi:DNA polymerase III alpha subunit